MIEVTMILHLYLGAPITELKVPLPLCLHTQRQHRWLDATGNSMLAMDVKTGHRGRVSDVECSVDPAAMKIEAPTS